MGSQKVLRTLLALCLVFTLIPWGAVKAEEAYDGLPAPRVDSPSCVVMDANSGAVLYKKDSDSKRPQASVTKVMTLLLAMEDLDSGKVKLQDEATCSERAWEMGGTEVWAEPGERMTLEEWLRAVAVASANDAAVIVAEFLSGSEEGFVGRMNKRAEELGMVNTVFKNPHGLDAEGHVTTAMDMAILARRATELPLLLEYTKIYQAPFRGGKNELTNFNKLVYLYPGCDGLKTGMTSKSGYCLAATAKRDDSRFIVTILGAENPDQRMNDAWRLLDWAFANYRTVGILGAKEGVARVRVLKGRKDSLGLRPKETLAVTLTKDQVGEVKRVLKIDDVLAPVKEGQVLGNVEIFVDDAKVKTVPLVAEENVERANFLDYTLRFLRAFTVGRW